MKSFFVTGATGNIGSFLIPKLVEKNYKIFCLVRPKNGQEAKERINNKNWNEDKNFKNLLDKMVIFFNNKER